VKEHSITRRLITAVLLLELLAALVLIGLTVFYEGHVRFHAFDVMLHGHADTLLGAVSDAEDEGDHLMLAMAGIVIPKHDLFRVQDDDDGGRVLGQSSTWPATGMKFAQTDKHGTLRLHVNGRRYRFIQVQGVRVVDPGKDGGVTHHVTVFYGAQAEQVLEEVNEAVRFYAIASILLLAITGLVMAWFLRRGLAPLRELADEAGRVSAEQWQFTAPESARATRELSPLAHAIEAALGRLQQSFQQQERFTSDAAHELKTDVAIVKSSLQLLAMRSRSVEEYKQGLEVCLRDCLRMEGTVQEMLTLAGMQYASRQEIASPTVTTDIVPCARETILRFAALAQLREVQTKLMVTEDGMTVRLDSKECALLCSNLLHNAIQHSPPSSEVKMVLVHERGSHVLIVEDAGEGIAPDVLPHVFEPFFRGDASRDRKSGGTGLGLAICKAICEKAGGSIEIASVLGQGTRVVARLPEA